MLAQVSDEKLQLGGLFDSLKIDVKQYKDIIESFKGLDFSKFIFKDENGKSNWDKIAESINGCDETALSYFKTLEDGNGVINNQAASIEGLTAHVNAAGQSFGSAALKSALLNTALNAGIFLAVSVALQTTVKAIDDYIHRNETLLEKAAEADSRINALNENYKSHKKTVEELGASYDKLSQGVDTATNQNISLSDEEYAEYLRITNELAETFPQLRTTVDENENAILHFSHQTKSAAENLDDLLASEQQIANYKISQELPDLFGGVSVKADELEAAKQKYDALSASASKYEENLARLDMTASDDVFSLQTDNSQAGIAYYSALSSAVQQFTNTLPAAQKEFFDLTQMVETNDAGISTIHFNLSSLDEGQKGKLQKMQAAGGCTGRQSSL